MIHNNSTNGGQINEGVSRAPSKAPWITTALTAVIIGIVILGVGYVGHLACHHALPEALTKFNILSGLKLSGSYALLGGGGLIALGAPPTLIGIAIRNQKKKLRQVANGPNIVPVVGTDKASQSNILPGIQTSKSPETKTAASYSQRLGQAILLLQAQAQQIKDKEIQSDIAFYLSIIEVQSETFLKEADTADTQALIWENIETELQCIEQNIKDFIETPIKDDKKDIETGKVEKAVPPLSLDAANWHEKVSGLLIQRKQEGIEAFILEGKAQNYLNLKLPRYMQGTLLHHCAKLDRYSNWTAALIQNGADPALQDEWGNTPLIWSVANASNGSAMRILEIAGKGPYLDVQCEIHGNSALHLVVGKGYRITDKDGKKLPFSNVELLKELVKNDAKVSLKNLDGNTPLHLAYARRDQEMIEILEKAGADLTLTNKEGKTPKDMEKMPYEDICTLLNKTVAVFTLEKF